MSAQPDDSLLSKLVQAERAERAVAKAKADAIARDHAAVVDAIHAAFEPYEEEISALQMKGGQVQCALQQGVTHLHNPDTRGKYRGPHGVIVRVSATPSVGGFANLHISVSARTDQTPMQVRLLRVSGTYARSETQPLTIVQVAQPEAFDAHSIVERLLRELVHFVA